MSLGKQIIINLLYSTLIEQNDSRKLISLIHPPDSSVRDRQGLLFPFYRLETEVERAREPMAKLKFGGSFLGIWYLKVLKIRVLGPPFCLYSYGAE